MSSLASSTQSRFLTGSGGGTLSRRERARSRKAAAAGPSVVTRAGPSRDANASSAGNGSNGKTVAGSKAQGRAFK
jgi:hypothetical protein